MKYDIERSFSIHTIPLYIKQFFTYDHKKIMARRSGKK